MLHHEYQTYFQPRWRIAIAGILIYFCLVGIYYLAIGFLRITEVSYKPIGILEHLVLFYISVYIGMWVLYFMSPFGRSDKLINHKILQSFFRVQSLRNLLNLTSRQRHAETAFDSDADADDPRWDEMNSKYQDKARTGMAAVAIFVATSFILIRQCLDTLDSVGGSEEVQVFVLFLLAAAFTASFISLVFFVTAIDDLDTVFNDFASRFENCVLDFYFFRRSANPRFLGLAFLVFAINLIVAVESRGFGCLTLMISFYVLYSHLYPVLQEKNIKGRAVLVPGKDYVWQRVFLLAFPMFLATCIFILATLW